MDARAILVENNQVAWARLRMALPGHICHERPFAIWSTTTRPAGAILVTRPRFSSDPEQFAAELNQVLRTYQEAGLPANWFWGPSGHPADLTKRLRARRFMGPHYLPGMAADLSQVLAEPEWPVGLIEDWTEFDSKPHPFCEFIPKAGRRDLRSILEESETEPRRVWSFVSRCDGEAAASATLFLQDGVAGIYDVATLPKHRNKGLAAAVLLGAMRFAQDRGAGTAILQAYAKAAGLYEKVGFATVCRYTSMVYSRVRMRADREAANS